MEATEAQKESFRIYYQNKKKAICAAGIRRYRANPEAAKAQNARWKMENKERARFLNKRWRGANKESQKRYIKKWRLAHPRLKYSLNEYRKKYGIDFAYTTRRRLRRLVNRI